MRSAEFPPDEGQRLGALYRYNVLDTEREEIFDELTELAATICDAPIALVSLIDQSRQWFKARIGLAAHETARSVSFCAHAILQPGLFVVPDTLLDSRFANNPLVTGAPNIRFYAGAPLFSEDGHGLGTLCVIDSVPRELTTQQKKALLVLRTHVQKLLELRLKSRQLVELNGELEAFNYMASHDLRAPLRAVKGFAEILYTDHSAGLVEEARGLIRRILDASNRMDQLIVDLLNLARVSRVTPEFVRVDLSKIAHEVAADLKRLQSARKVEINIEPNLVVLGDTGLLRSVIENLLGNAWKFTVQRAPARIEFRSERVNGKLQFVVQDNGAGFDMAYTSKLFQPFQRLHSGAAYPGTGVGLSIVKRIVERHGGTIWADATPGDGATFRFTLSKCELGEDFVV